MKIKKVKGLLSGIAIICLVLSILLSAFHYHDKGKIDNHCPLCRFQVYNHISDKAIVEYKLNIPKPNYKRINVDDVIIPSYYHHISIHCHAPPLIQHDISV